jgi:hypothetical protein
MSARVAITISDPWELVTACGSGPFEGEVIDVRADGIVVRLDAPIVHGGVSYSAAACQVRHEGKSVSDMMSSVGAATTAAFVPGAVGASPAADRSKELIFIGSVSRA